MAKANKPVVTGLVAPRSNVKEFNFKFPSIDKMINERFFEIFNNKDRYLILYGSRGSSKTDAVCTMIVYRMLADKCFRGLALRHYDVDIMKSTFSYIKKVISRYGLEEHFVLNSSPKRITCKLNDNVLYFMGFEDPEKCKGVDEANFIWYEENVPDDEFDFETISTSLRSTKAKYIQEVFTINPIIPEYENHWFWRKFFMDETELSYKKKFEITTEDNITYTQYATIHHSSYRDNKWLDPNALAKIELMIQGDPYLYQVFKLGVWANKIIEGRYFSQFDITKNISMPLKEYNPDKPLHLSYDFNRRPFSALAIAQVYGNEFYVIDEICTLNREITASPLTQACEKFKLKYAAHTEGVYIYGDPAGRAESSSAEQGTNQFSIIVDELKSFNPILRVQTKAPSLKTNGEWINSIFSDKQDIKIFINSNCKNIIKDLLYLKIDKEGGTFKEKIKDSDGVTVEKYGHVSDAFRYMVTSYFLSDWDNYNSRHKFKPILIPRFKKHGY